MTDEANKKLTDEIITYFNGEILKLNEKGTENSRGKIAEMQARQKYFLEKLEFIDEQFNKHSEAFKEHEHENKSDIKSIQFGQKIWFEKSVPEQNKKIDIAVSHAVDASHNTAEAGRSARNAQEAAERACQALKGVHDVTKSTNFRLTLLVITLICGLLGTGFFAFIKYQQDYNNQKQLIEYLQSGVAVKKNGGNEYVNELKRVDR